MRHRILILILTIGYLGLRPIYSQQTKPEWSIPNIIPSTPQSQIFETYINHQVTGYNGLPEITIPLGEVSLKDISFPIALSYHVGNVKYGVSAGDIGLGWSILASGFRVSRTVLGKADEQVPFFNIDKFNQIRYANKPKETDGYLSSLTFGYQYIINPHPFSFQDSDYDRFNYSNPTSSGVFIISDRENKKIVTSELNNYSVTYNCRIKNSSPIPQAVSQICSINMVDDRGNTFYYGGTQSGVDLIEEDYTKITTTGWPLREIRTKNNENITFEYEYFDVNNYFYNYSQYLITDGAKEINRNIVLDMYSNETPEIESAAKGINLNQVRSFSERAAYLKKIKYNNCTIEFIRKKYLENSFLDTIVFHSGNNRMKTIVFDYLQVDSQNVRGLILKGVSIYDKYNNEKKQYNLDYYMPNIGEEKLNFYPDQWNNFKLGTTQKDYDVIHDIFKKEKYVQSYNNYETKKIEEMFNMMRFSVFENRETNTGVPYFTLKKITYPTGGESEYIYEPNKARFFNQIMVGNGYRIAKIINRNNSLSTAKTVQYIYGEDGTGIIPSLKYSSLTSIPHLFMGETYHYYADSRYDNLIRSVTTQRTYSTNELNGGLINSMNIFYNKFSMVDYEGKQIYYYNLPNTPQIAAMEDFSYAKDVSDRVQGLDYYIKNQIMGYSPYLSTKVILNNKLDTVQVENYTYKNIDKGTYKGLSVKQKVFINNYDFLPNIENGAFIHLMNYPYYNIRSFFNYGNTELQVGVYQLLDKESIFYDKGRIATTESYTYDNLNRLKSTSVTNSTKGTKTKVYTYPDTDTELVKNNILSTIIQTEMKNNEQAVGVEKTEYPINSIYPSVIKISNTDINNLHTQLIYNRHDTKGNLQQHTTSSGISTVYLWSYNGQYPIAEIKNATFIEAETAAQTVFSVASADALSTLAIPNETKLKDGSLQKALPNALVTTYTYKPLVGMLTATKPSGITTYYDYDAFGRLKETYMMKNGIKKIIQKYDYHYQNQSNIL